MTTTPPAPRPAVAARFIGKSVTRKEDQRLLTGHGLYVDDVKVSGTLHAAFLRSDLARAAITGIDTGAAKELPGVVAVFTWEDFNGISGPGYHSMMSEELLVPPPLAITDVRYVGDPVAMVIAETRYVAEDTCELIEVDYDPQTAVVDYTRAAADTENVVHAGWGLESNAMVQVPFTPLSPDLDEVFASAAHVVECDVEQNRYVAMPMETRGIVASYNKGRQELDIASATQSVHETENFFARYVQIPEGHVHVTARDVGGGFGQKMFVYREECAVVLASFLLGQPVKWIEDRRENLLSAGHSRNEFAHVKVAVDADGIIQAITADHVCDVGHVRGVSRGHGPDAPAGSVQDAPARVLHRDGVDQHHGQGRRTAARGCSRPPRRRWRSTTPPRRSASTPRSCGGATCSPSATSPSPRPAATCSRRSPRSRRWSRRSSSSTTRRSARSRPRRAAQGRHLGVGICSYVEPTSMGSNTLATEAATVKVETSGHVVAYLGTTAHGQSIETTMAQIVAEHLGVAYDDVTIVQADSRSTPYGPGTGGSRTTVVAGGGDP